MNVNRLCALSHRSIGIKNAGLNYPVAARVAGAGVIYGGVSGVEFLLFIVSYFFLNASSAAYCRDSAK